MSDIQHLCTRQAYIPYVLMVRWLELHLVLYTRDLVGKYVLFFSGMQKCACCISGKKKLLVWKCIKCALHLSTTTVTYPDHGATMHLKNWLKRKQEIFYLPWTRSNYLIWGWKLCFWSLIGISKQINVCSTHIYAHIYM